MKVKYIVIIIFCVITIIGGIFYFGEIKYDWKKAQMDNLYTYFHKIQDSIRAKHYPINMDSLKGTVYDQRNTIIIYSKLKDLEDSVKVYK